VHAGRGFSRAGRRSTRTVLDSLARPLVAPADAIGHGRQRSIPKVYTVCER